MVRQSPETRTLPFFYCLTRPKIIINTEYFLIAGDPPESSGYRMSKVASCVDLLPHHKEVNSMKKYKLSGPTDDPTEVIRLLFPQDRKYNSNVSLFYRNGETMNYLDKVHPADLANAISECSFYDGLDYYIAANTFVKNYGRTQATLFSLNNIVIDIDMHTIDQLLKSNKTDKIDLPEGYVDLVEEDNLYDDLRPQLDKTDELCQELYWRLQRDLFCDIPPNVVHMTGRGIQFWWHLEETSKQLLWLYQQVCDKLLLLLDNFLHDNPDLQNVVQVDSVASKNAAGLFRLFGTYNTKVKSQSRYEIIHHNSYMLNGLKVVLDEILESKEVNQAKEHHPKTNNRRKNTNTRRKSNDAKKPRPRTAQYKRMWIIDKVVEGRADHVTTRNKTMFLASQNARMIMPTEDWHQYCTELNQKFSTPLPSIEKYLNEKKQYLFTDSVFCDYLGITIEKFQELSKEYYATHRNDARKVRVQERKAEKEQRYQECQRLRNEGYSVAKIHEITNVSINSIKRHTTAPQRKQTAVISQAS